MGAYIWICLICIKITGHLEYGGFLVMLCFLAVTQEAFMYSASYCSAV